MRRDKFLFVRLAGDEMETVKAASRAAEMPQGPWARAVTLLAAEKLIGTEKRNRKRRQKRRQSRKRGRK